jgi:signal peptidase I
MMFALFMIVILVITGGIWLLDILVLRKRRAAGESEPILVEYAKSFFPVILIVFMVRSFIVEPFKIPSGSMMPTLLAGDYILVNKFTYGLRVPILNHVFVEMDKPARGDVVVFHYPPDTSIDYIKRVIGMPGDRVSYQDKQLSINGKKVELSEVGNYEYVMSGLNIISAKQYREQLGTVSHDILIHDFVAQYDADAIGAKFANNEEVVVPAGHYLAMGDNRDNSSDSRVWGFVPENNLVGKAFFIWMNFDYISKIFDKDSRIGNSIQ